MNIDMSLCPKCNTCHPTYASNCSGKRNLKQKEYRIKTGVTSGLPERNKVNGVYKSNTKEYKRMSAKADKAKRRKHGRPSIKLIQLIYEDNIKEYGTLTCYICKDEILLGNDHLEHKIPLSRGGKNEYDNLEVSCAKCNLQKSNKTLEEYLTWKKRDS